jgi:peptidoglycan/LPS O-acetylase OafA/YrhL
MAAPPQGRRNTNLDALRAIAILMVLGHHAGQAIALLHGSNRYTIYWERVGWAGVDLFFVLSGFLISGLLFSSYQERSQLDVSRFYIRRGLKIWPAFYTLIAIGVLLDVARGHHIITNYLLSELFFLQDYFRSIWGITWSLAVEEHFYLILPLVLLLMIRLDRERPFAAMPYVFTGIAIFSLTCRFAVGWKENGIVDYWVCYFPTHLRMDGLMFGVLLCYCQRFRPNWFERIVSWRGGWIVIAAAVVLLSTIPESNRNMHTWGYTVLYLGAGILVSKAVAFEGTRPIRVISSLLARIGLYSYSIYLWHMFFIWRILPHFNITAPLVVFWSSIVGPILFGIAAAKLIEIPVLRFRDRVFPAVPKSRVVSETPASSEDLREAPSGSVVAD